MQVKHMEKTIKYLFIGDERQNSCSVQRGNLHTTHCYCYFNGALHHFILVVASQKSLAFIMFVFGMLTIGSSSRQVGWCSINQLLLNSSRLTIHRGMLSLVTHTICLCTHMITLFHHPSTKNTVYIAMSISSQALCMPVDHTLSPYMLFTGLLAIISSS